MIENMFFDLLNISVYTAWEIINEMAGDHHTSAKFLSLEQYPPVKPLWAIGMISSRHISKIL